MFVRMTVFLHPFYQSICCIVLRSAVEINARKKIWTANLFPSANTPFPAFWLDPPGTRQEILVGVHYEALHYIMICKLMGVTPTEAWASYPAEQEKNTLWTSGLQGWSARVWTYHVKFPIFLRLVNSHACERNSSIHFQCISHLFCHLSLFFSQCFSVY